MTDLAVHSLTTDVSMFIHKYLVAIHTFLSFFLSLTDNISVTA